MHPPLPEAKKLAERPKRRWLRFRLRTFLFVCAAIAVFLGWLGNVLVRVRHQRQIVARITAAGGEVRYDYEFEPPETIDGSLVRPHPPGPWLIRKLLGDDAFAYVVYVHDHESRITDADIAQIDELPKLKWLYISGEGITDKSIQTIAKIPALELLTIGSTRVTGNGVHQLAPLRNLHSLGLSGSTVTDETLRHIGELKCIRELAILRTEITSAGLKSVGRLHELRELKLYDNQRLDDHALESLAGLTQLKRLSLWRTAIGDRGLAGLRPFTALENLSLTNCPVSDEGMQHVASLRNLHALFLTNTNVGDEGARALSVLTNLERLHIENTPVTDSGFSQLMVLKNLKEFHFGPRITEAAAINAQQQLPNCLLRWVSQTGGYTDIPSGQSNRQASDD